LIEPTSQEKFGKKVTEREYKFYVLGFLEGKEKMGNKIMKLTQ